jgi:hypothetical protein
MTDVLARTRLRISSAAKDCALEPSASDVVLDERSSEGR